MEPMLFETSIGVMRILDRTADGQYTLSWDFQEGSGKAAKDLAAKFIEELFLRTDCLVIWGDIHQDNKLARRFAIGLGFTNLPVDANGWLRTRLRIGEWCDASGRDRSEVREGKLK